MPGYAADNPPATELFHIVDVGNLQTIIGGGFLLSDHLLAQQGGPNVGIGCSHIKHRRMHVLQVATKLLDLREGVVEEADNYLVGADDINKRMDRVSRLIDGFEDPFGMELLATVHWVMVQSPEARANSDVAVKLVLRSILSCRHYGSAVPESQYARAHRALSEDWPTHAASL